jgi:3-oxoacyl-[acyl-carrier protein] reductase
MDWALAPAPMMVIIAVMWPSPATRRSASRGSQPMGPGTSPGLIGPIEVRPAARWTDRSSSNMKGDTLSTSTTDRVAIVTGGSGAIGRSVAERLAKDGQAVAVHYAGNKEKADEIVSAVTAAGGTAMSVAGDVADENDMRSAFDAVEAEFGGIDVVVNTAGLMVLSPIVTLDLDDLDRMHRTNIRGTFVVSQQAARRVRTGGAIINISTSVTRTQLPGYGGYVASKAAVEGMTLILARELRGKDITVNTVAPGPIATPLFLDGKDEATIAEFTKAAPLERLGRPEDVAETVSFVAGAARWVNGQVIYTNGGLA